MNSSPSKWVVAQLGARMHYAVPQILSLAGVLGALVTDFYRDQNLQAIEGILPARFRNKMKRYYCSSIDHDAVYAANVRSALSAARRLVPPKQVAYQNWNEREARFLSKRIAKNRFDEQFGSVYGFDTASLEIFREWKGHGQKVLEQCVAPRSEQQAVYDIQCKMRSIVKDVLHEAHLERQAIRETAEWRLADKILVPSEYVSSCMPQAEEIRKKIVVVPYGAAMPSEESYIDACKSRLQNCNNPVTFLFAGKFGLRKGAFELIHAAEILGEAVSIEIAGHVDAEFLASRPSNLRFLGHLTREELNQAFGRANVFVLPSWLEGSATVIYEAMGWGIPVVTTASSGSVVANGVDGILVKRGDGEELAQAMRTLTADQSLREALGKNAREKSQDYTVGRYGERLLSAIEGS